MRRMNICAERLAASLRGPPEPHPVMRLQVLVLNALRHHCAGHSNVARDLTRYVVC